MTKCSRCQMRTAIIFVTRIENGESKQEGICMKCARELGIKPIDDMIKNLGLSDEDIERMTTEMDNVAQSMENGGDFPFPMPEGDGETEDPRAPTIDFGKLMNQGAQSGGDSGAKEKGKDKKGNPKERKYLNTYCTNLTKKAAAGKLDNVIGRERDLGRVIQILCRRQKNNPCLIGEPGVGKTAIAEALAQKIASGDVPYRLQKSEIYLVDLTALVAGTQFRGQFEARVLGLLNEVKSAGNIILVIDEVHNLVGAGDAEGSMNAANILKPALSRGEIQVIGATTMKEYRKYIEKDSALERRFQPVVVEEPSMSDTESILRGIKHYYEEYHSIRIPDGVLSYAVKLSERYITDRFLPDKAIDLIDEAASHISLSCPQINERAKLMDENKALSAEQTELEAKISEDAQPEEYERLAEVKTKVLQNEKRIGELSLECESVEMTVADLADVIEIWTGIPAASIAEDEFEGLEGLEERLRQRIVGQDEAVRAVARAVKRGRVGVSAKRKPVSFIFAGPTGVGKTELVRVLANDLFKTPDTLVRLDMSEYMDKFSVSRIIGSPPGYVGYDDAGQLTERIRRHPYSVVLFDEIEKAHPDVMNILLQILDDGRITDSQGRTVNFENTIIVLTTNAGSGGTAQTAGFFENPSKAVADRTMKALSEFLRPEFINRIDEVITFNQLTPDNFVGIAKIMLDELAASLSEKFISFTYTEDALRYIAENSYSAKYGARNMRRFIRAEVEDVIAQRIIESRAALSGILLQMTDGKPEIKTV